MIYILFLYYFLYFKSKPFQNNYILIAFSSLSKQAGQNRTKMDSFITYPLRGLDIGEFSTLTPDSPLTGDPKSPTATYDLYAVCNHYGNLTAGHYTGLWNNVSPIGVLYTLGCIRLSRIFYFTCILNLYLIYIIYYKSILNLF